jgi:hypothetical protein
LGIDYEHFPGTLLQEETGRVTIPARAKSEVTVTKPSLSDLRLAPLRDRPARPMVEEERLVDVFRLRGQVVGSYAACARGFLRIDDPDIKQHVGPESSSGRLRPDRLV